LLSVITHSKVDKGIQSYKSNQGEVRIPSKLVRESLRTKSTKVLHFFYSVKRHGHRAEIKSLLQELKLSPRKGRDLISRLVAKGLAHTDGTFIFPRSWRRIKVSKRAGLYLTTHHTQKKFDSLLFAHAMKKVIRARSHSFKGRVMPNVPQGYYIKALGIPRTRFQKLQAQCIRYRYISSLSQYTRLGKANEVYDIRKYLHPQAFKYGQFTVVREPSKISILL
jgi:hypothetical protein